MARALAIETSGRLGAVAILDGGEIVGLDSFEHGLKHAAEMIPRIDALLKAVGWKPVDVREIYVSIGPGSFTGLRIGVTLAKTLALVSGAKIVAVPTVLALAENAPREARNVLIVLDAKRDQIFTASLQREMEDQPWRLVDSARLDSLAHALAKADRPVHLIGEGIPSHEKFIPDDASIVVTPPEAWRSQAAAVARIGARMAKDDLFTDPDALLPLYIRRPEAEEKFDAAHL